MRNGFKVYDADTHVMPLAEVLEQYVDPSFRPRLAELAPYRVPARNTGDGTAQRHRYSVQTRFYRRVLGEAGPHPTFTGRGGTWRGTKAPRPGVQDDQAGYVGGTAPLKRKPSDYLTSGRFFSTIERHEGEDMFNVVTQFLGDDVLMYASDYPHAECQFPNSVDNVLRWSNLKPDTMRKLLWDNASRFYKQT